MVSVYSKFDFGLPRSADRLALPPTYRDTDIGFRCATPDPP